MEAQKSWVYVLQIHAFSREDNSGLQETLGCLAQQSCNQGKPPGLWPNMSVFSRQKFASGGAKTLPAMVSCYSYKPAWSRHASHLLLLLPELQDVQNRPAQHSSHLGTAHASTGSVFSIHEPLPARASLLRLKVPHHVRKDPEEVLFVTPHAFCSL